MRLEPGDVAVYVLSAVEQRRPAGTARGDPRVQALLRQHARSAGDGPPHMSCSHAGPWLCVALADAPLGVDIETWNRRRHGAAFRRFLLSREAEPPQQHGPPGSADEQQRAVRLWSRLEALTKCEGLGLSTSLQALRVPGGPLPRACQVRAPWGERWLMDLPSPHGVVASLVLRQRPKRVRLQPVGDADWRADGAGDEWINVDGC